MTPEEKAQLMVAKAYLDSALAIFYQHNSSVKRERDMVHVGAVHNLAQAQAILGNLGKAEAKQTGYKSMGRRG